MLPQIACGEPRSEPKTMEKAIFLEESIEHTKRANLKQVDNC